MMTRLSVATCDRALAPGAAPEWVHLFPDGKMTGRDGRTFDLTDPKKVIMAFQSRGVDLPIDYEHQNDRPEARLRGPVPAAGWIKELKHDAGGLWGRAEWTATAREMIANRQYRYLSPSFLFHAATGAIVRLKGAGLVHNPNLHLTALASQDTEMDTDDAFRQQLAGAMGLGPDATPEEMLALVTKMMGMMAKATGKPEMAQATMAELMTAISTPDPAKYVPIEAVRGMLTERNASRATQSQERAETKVATAMRDGYLSPGMKGWATALCASDEASFDAFVAGSIPPFVHLSKSHDYMNVPPKTKGAGIGGSDVADAICAQLGLAPGALND
jgi:phage I-like protein